MTTSKAAAGRKAHQDVVHTDVRATSDIESAVEGASLRAQSAVEGASSRAQSAVDEASVKTTLTYMDARQSAVKLRESASSGLAATVEGGRTYIHEVGEASRRLATTYAANTGSTLKAAVKFQSVVLSPGLLLLDAGAEGGRTLGQQLNKAAQQVQTTTRETVQRAQRAVENLTTPASTVLVIASETTTVEVKADVAAVKSHPSRYARKN